MTNNLPLFRVISGAAGTGKTFHVRSIMEQYPKHGVFAATTGIAAVNLGTRTINSILGYFDLDSIEDHYQRGGLTKRIAALARHSEMLYIDESSMLDGRVLDIIKLAVDEVNERETTKRPFGITLVADFCQLPPINAPWVFNSTSWSAFSPNITRLTKFWRQSDTAFLDALQSARAGNGPETANRLKAIPSITWRHTAGLHFDGTTIVGVNDEAKRINNMEVSRLPGSRVFRVSARTQGLLRPEWKHLQDDLTLKVGAYVMILVNDPDPLNQAMGTLRYANGSCGHVVDVDGSDFLIQLVKDGKPTAEVVRIGAIDREYLSKEPKLEVGKGNWVEGKYDEGRKRYWYGEIHYFPLRPAYASTVHKSQGLSLDKVQVDVRHHFMGSPAMVYVALSRCKSPQGLTIVGDAFKLASRVRIHEEVKPWL